MGLNVLTFPSLENHCCSFMRHVQFSFEPALFISRFSLTHFYHYSMSHNSNNRKFVKWLSFKGFECMYITFPFVLCLLHTPAGNFFLFFFFLYYRCIFLGGGGSAQLF